MENINCRFTTPPPFWFYRCSRPSRDRVAVRVLDARSKAVRMTTAAPAVFTSDGYHTCHIRAAACLSLQRRAATFESPPNAPLRLDRASVPRPPLLFSFSEALSLELIRHSLRQLLSSEGALLHKSGRSQNDQRPGPGFRSI